MGAVKDENFYVEDETPEELQRTWDSGAPVLVIPSRLRRNLRHVLAKLLQRLSDESARGAARLRSNGPASGRSRSPRAAIHGRNTASK